MLSVVIGSLLLTLPVLVTAQPPGSPIFVSAPNIIRVGNEETVLVSVYNIDPLGVDVTVSFKNQDGTIINSVTIRVHEADPQIVKLFVDPTAIPVIENDENLKRYALVAVDCADLGYEEENEVLLSFQHGYLFIQTDKPIYTPSQTVSIRLINLDQYMTPASQKIQLDIRTPQNITVKRQIFEADEVNGFVADTFKFPDEPMFGNWSVLASYGKDMAVNTSVQFEVKEYVLPTFSVKITPPDYILRTDDEISIIAKARYVYNKPVNGRAFFRVGIVGNDGRISIDYTEAIFMDSGIGTLHIIPRDVFGEDWFDVNLDCRLFVGVTVVEHATGQFENSTDTSAIFVNSPYIFSWKRTVPYFKKGPYAVKTDLAMVNGKLASGIAVSVSAIATLANGGKLPLVGEIVDGINQPTEKNTNGKGQVDFPIFVTPECRTITIQLTTMEEDLKIDGEDLGNNAHLSFDIHMFEGGNSVLVIRPVQGPIQPGTELNVDVFLAPDLRIPHLSYFVISRGRIIDARIKNDVLNVDGFSIIVTYDMIPSARVVAYYINGAGQVIVDSFWLEIERICENQLSVVFENRDSEAIHDIEPSREVELNVQARPNTMVGLLAVDKAVYLLRDFHRLTQDKMYKRMDTYDTGCGPGSGRNAADAFKNAGITVLTNLNDFDVIRREEFDCSTPVNGRKRRSIESQRAHYADDEGKAYACKRGHKLLGNFNCSDRAQRFIGADVVRRKLGDMSEEREAEIFDVFLGCCQVAEIERRDRASEIDLTDERHISLKIPDDFNIRNDFPEMWFNEIVNTGPTGSVRRSYTTPGSITEWSVQAVGLTNNFAMCVIEPVELLVRSKFFIQLRLPYSVIRMEQIEVLVTVFNYGHDDLAVRMFMETNEKICSEESSDGKLFTVKASDAYTVAYVVIGLEIGEHPIKVLAFGAGGVHDGVSKKLRVVPEGVERTIQHTTLLNPQQVRNRQQQNLANDEELQCEGMEHFDGFQKNCLEIDLPEDAIPDSQSCHVSLIGNLLGPVITSIISGLDSLIRLPRGCGEQTMIYLSPNVYILRYFRAAHDEQQDIDAKAVANIESGIAREQTYRHPSGGFSAFARRAPSTWLTAFVTKVFSHASELVFVDETTACRAMKWMIESMQRADGAFMEGLAVIHREMTGGVQGDASLTAYVLIALSESKCEQHPELITTSKNSATRFLEDQLDALERPYTVAIVTYALALTGSRRINEANTKLRRLATYDEATDTRYWGVDISSLAGRPVPYMYRYRPSAISVETSSYALLAQLALGEISYSHSIVKWLSQQQNYGGSFTSTQDTVIALEALSEYASLNRGGDLDMDCTVSVPHTLYRTDFHFDTENAFIQQQDAIPEEFITGKVVVNTTGQGIGKLNIEVRYNIPTTDLEDCKFTLGISARRDDGRRRSNFEKGDTITVRVCTSYLGEERTGMSILDIGLFTGFTPVKETLDELVAVRDDNLIQRYEHSKRSVIIYADHIPNINENNDALCVEFKAECEFAVNNIQQVAVSVYDYYKPDEQCTKFYKPAGIGGIQTLCTGRICSCVTSQCADPAIDATSDYLRERGCRAAKTYVYKITIQSMEEIGGFKKHNATINDDFKTGNEEDIIAGDVRTFWKSSSCDYPKFDIGRSYIVIGENTLEYVKPDKSKGIKYIIDKTSFVKRWRKKYLAVGNDIKDGRGNCG